MERKHAPKIAALLVVSAASVGGVLWAVGDSDKPATSETEPDEEFLDRPSGRGSAPVLGIERVRASPGRVVPDVNITNGRLSGRVVSLGTQSGVHAALTFVSGDESEEVLSNNQGEFSFAPRESKTYTLALVTASGHLPYAPEWGQGPIEFSATAGHHVTGVEVHLSPAVLYRGLVLSSDGEPVGEAEVQVHEGPDNQQSLLPVSADYRTADDGTFEFQAADGAMVEAEHPAHGRARGVVDFSVQTGRQMTLRLGDLAPEATGDEHIAGTVVDSDGEPLPDVLLTAFAAQDNPRSRTRSRPDGTFRIEGLDRVSHTVLAQAPGFARWAEREVAAGANLEVTLEPELVVRGVVTGPDGPVASATVVAQQQRGLISETVAVVSTFSADGNFELRGLGDGTLQLIAGAAGFAPSESLMVTLPSTTPVELALRVGGTLRGQVTAAGVVLEGARVSLEGTLVAEGGAMPLVDSSVTDAEGRYSISGVTPGLGSLIFAAEAHHSRIRSGLFIEEGGELIVDVELTPTEDGEEPRIELAGIGAALRATEETLVVEQVIDGGGAAEVGLQVGDEILTVEGESVRELGFGGSIQLIRGPEGSTVRLQVRRGEEESEILVPRRRIRA